MGTDMLWPGREYEFFFFRENNLSGWADSYEDILVF